MYLVFGALWILLTDRYVTFLAEDVVTLEEIQIFKGLFFVLTSAIVIYFTSAWLNRRVLKREDQMNTLFRHEKIALLVTNSKGIIIEASPNTHKILGYSHLEMIGENWHEYEPPMSGKKAVDGETQVPESDDFEDEKSLIHRDGHLVPVVIKGRLKRKSDDSIDYCSSVIEDISELVRLNDARERQRRFTVTALMKLQIGVSMHRIDTGEHT